MMKQNGNTSEQSERGLLPYVVIVAATKGDPEAMKMVVQHYEGYISYLSTRTLKDERGNTYYGIDGTYATACVQNLCELSLTLRFK